MGARMGSRDLRRVDVELGLGLRVQNLDGGFSKFGGTVGESFWVVL